MSRILSVPPVAAAARELRGPEPATDPFTAALVAEAHTRGLREGAAAGRAAAAADCRHVVAGLQNAIDRATAEIRALHAAQASATVELAAAIAEVVVGRQPDDDASGLLRRVRDALAQVDDPGLVVHADPADVAALAAGLADLTGVQVVADPAVGPGQARVTGTWAQAELTHAAAWAAVRKALGV